jgi:hypothetical protein
MKQSAKQIQDYARPQAKRATGRLQGTASRLATPVRGARAIVAAQQADQPPLQLVLGGDALDQFRKRVAEPERDWKDWEEATRSTDFSRQ